MVVFKAAQGSLSGGLNTLSQNAMTLTTLTDGAEVLTAAECVNGVLVIPDGGDAANVQFPTAEAVVALIPNCVVGTSFLCMIRNDDAGDDKTVTVNTGTTIVGTAAIQEATTGTFLGVVTAVDTEALVMYRIA